MEITGYVRATRAEVLRIIHSIPEEAKQTETVFVRASKVVLSRIERAFLVKSRGGTDETGDRWKSLSPVTVAKRLRRQQPTSEHDRPSSALSAAQREAWWGRYRAALAKYHDKSTAAKIAWTQTKRFGGAGHYDKYGSGTTGILRDTEALLDSLRPDSQSPYKVLRVRRGVAELGTNRKGALAHHLGAKNLPQRRLWPHPSRWTSAWWGEVLRSARSGVVELIVEKLK